MGRQKTLSKNFYDDEIKYIAPNGDIHLHDGVKRLKYNDIEESYINDDEIAARRKTEMKTRLGLDEDDI